MARRARRPAHTGVLLLDKPKGRTSHDVVQSVRRVYGQREVGHTGTLDPMATGLMILTLGRATRLGRFLEAADKSYDGTVVLGQATTTFDAEGEVTETAPVENVTEADVERVMATLTGSIEQQVPAFSAVKVDGERLYEKARRKEAVDAPTRTVNIERLELLGFDGKTIELSCSVSKGTYIRSLAVQIGAALGLPAHLSRLVRTRVGPHRLADATSLDALVEHERPAEVLTDSVAALPHLSKVVLSEADLEDVRHGRPLTAGQVRAMGVAAGEGDPILLVRSDGQLAAVAHLIFGPEALAGEEARARAVRYACVLDSPDPQP